MLEARDINLVDSDGLWRAYGKWSQASRRALEQKLELPKVRNPRLIVLGGMGGSGTACDIIHDWLSRNSKIPSVVVKDSHLPRFVNSRSLVFVISLSGNTEEALSLLTEASGRGMGCGNSLFGRLP